MSLSEEAQRKWSVSADAWIEGMRQGDVNRTHLLDAPVRELCGDVAGLEVLDVGCGEGRFCRRLAGDGAVTTGLDPTPELLAEARRLHPEGVYVEASAEAMPFDDAAFDLVLTYLTLIDIPDFRAAIGEMARVLRPEGRLVIANLQSYATTRPRAWHVDEAGNKLHLAVEDYYDERALLLQWAGLSIYNWHRPFEAYMQPLLRAGLVLTDFREPRPTPEAVAENPTMLDEYRVPLFHVMAWRKPSG
ncbi:MAG: class I SAM-dependent methyltransferase [Fimbriimonas sp.]